MQRHSQSEHADASADQSSHDDALPVTSFFVLAGKAEQLG
jgi:hypothetical protein